MNTTRRKFVAGSLAVGALPSSVLAQDQWPSRPLRIISGGSAGGGSDMFVRTLEARLKERLGQSLYIDNKPGAGGMLAAGLTSSAPPDGYTYYVSNVATNAIGLALYAKPTFDPVKDLPGVARISTLTNAVVVRADSGISSIGALIAYMRANPEKVFFGSAGVGTSSHLGGHLFVQKVGVDGKHVPYKGTAANVTALLAGEVLFSMDNLPLYVQHVKAGKLRLLAMTQSKRSPSFPDVPTIQEAAGIGEFDIFSWYGLSASTGTPKAILERMGGEVVSALKDPGIVAAVRELGAEAAPLGPAEYQAFVQAEIRKWAPIVKSSGASVS
ncbi:Bug family tripartite tricarboxylate transporter substrate binding protein [Ottowia thiooxydans]|uniref:Tripartite-type tricarboxylate transporter receptor subunit TctC n=1 Tax=Ottowia thiooxydans TaxID=219182 RepID=A0ABV2QC39_9BURK